MSRAWESDAREIQTFPAVFCIRMMNRFPSLVKKIDATAWLQCLLRPYRCMIYARLSSLAQIIEENFGSDITHQLSRKGKSFRIPVYSTGDIGSCGDHPVFLTEMFRRFIKVVYCPVRKCEVRNRITGKRRQRNDQIG